MGLGLSCFLMQCKKEHEFFDGVLGCAFPNVARYCHRGAKNLMGASEF